VVSDEEVRHGERLAVTVSGASANPCGHMMLNLGGCGPDAQYFHVCGNGYNPNWFPLMLDQGQYIRYLTSNKTKEWKRAPLVFPNPKGVRLRFEQLLSQKWM
jgi:hypothetical protein